jgi:hypothetical protein
MFEPPKEKKDLDSRIFILDKIIKSSKFLVSNEKWLKF